MQWQPIETAPLDGTPIQAKIPGHGSDNIIAWREGFIDSNEQDCCAWVFLEDQEPPSSWTDGVCWEVNEDSQQSVKPTHWQYPNVGRTPIKHPEDLNPMSKPNNEHAYPAWICVDCGAEYGRVPNDDHLVTFHLGKCGWCNEVRAVTAPRDYRWPTPPRARR